MNVIHSNAVPTKNVAVVQHYTILRTRSEEHQCSEAVEALPAAQYDHTSLSIGQTTEVFNHSFIYRKCG